MVRLEPGKRKCTFVGGFHRTSKYSWGVLGQAAFRVPGFRVSGLGVSGSRRGSCFGFRI